MCDGEYRYDLTLKLKPEATFNEAERLADELYQNTMYEIVHEINVTRVDGCLAISIDDALFEGDNFEDTLVKSNLLSKMQDQQYYCFGQNQRYYYRINNGVIEECGTVQEPDNNWRPYLQPVEGSANVRT